MIYKCIHCGKQLDLDLKKSKKVICQYCGYRVIEKAKIGIVKRVSAV